MTGPCRAGLAARETGLAQSKAPSPELTRSFPAATGAVRLRLRPVGQGRVSRAEWALLVVRCLAVATVALAAAASGRLGEARVLLLLGTAAFYVVATGTLTITGSRAGQWTGPLRPLVDLGLVAWAGQVFGAGLTGLYFLVVLLSAMRYGAGWTLAAGILSSLLYLFVDSSSGWPGLARPEVLAQAVGLVAVGAIGGYLGELREAERREKERYSECERSKADLLSVLPHELRTPLAMVKGAVDLLLEGHPGPTNKQQVTFLTTISDQTERLIALVEDLLATAWMEAGKLELKLAPVDVRVPAREAVRAFRPLAAKKRQDVHLEYPQVLGHVRADARWVQQVLINLLSNASKYTTDGGHIYVAIAENRSHVLTSVTDDGAGIPREERRRYFEPFMRGRYSNEQGTGLGLAIVKHLVEKHGGRVMLDTSLGQGTTILFTLPKEAPDGGALRRRSRWNGLRLWS